MLTKRHLAGVRAASLIATLTLAACTTQQEAQTVYCYRTLADVGCYTEPDPGREGRLVGTYLRGPELATAPVEPLPAESPGQGALARWVGASLDLAGRLVTPLGPIIGLFVDP